ncbi:hypothetical protein H7J06_21455 [Mycobacterium hodleri]|uniref:YncE family protein n=1 Tax=Mycolicibacterium hodleri TaxID=49897 RepID=UPI0021F39B2A|nr:hypothetical protein [Mycolicibacterium hodleri]MCV7135547.1 hypothetical protein [Mycolicibacterium hodleri]
MTTKGVVLLGYGGDGVAISPDGSKVYAESMDSTGTEYVNVFDAGTLSLTNQTSSPLLEYPNYALSPDGHFLYAAQTLMDNGGGGTVYVFDTTKFPAASAGTGTGGTSGGGSSGGGTTGGGTSTGGTGSAGGNDAMHLWIDSIGTIFDDFKVGVIGSALHVSVIFDDLAQGRFGDALYDTVQLGAGALETNPIFLVRGLGIFLDLSAQAAKSFTTSGPPLSPSEFVQYLITHPFDAAGGATSAVVGAIGNTIGHTVGVPQIAINAVVDPAVQGIIDGAHTLETGFDHGVDNVLHARWPWS